jgi:tocopherol O-methyltransferase
MIECPSVTKSAIASHYNVSTFFYWLLWGRHLHHGLWHADESPKRAQQNLTDTLIKRVGLHDGDRVLDVGCGMGGSSIHMAKAHGCEVTGLTLSRVQKFWASSSSRWHWTSRRTKFVRQDAESADFAPNSFDVIWIIECSEHLFDKPQFFERAAKWLRPGGRIGVCAWLAAEEPHSDLFKQQIYDVCEGMVCPSLGSFGDYRQWLESAGLRVTAEEDWTDQVKKTWDICLERVRRTRMHILARLIDRRILLFLERFVAMQEAYESGAMRYGCIIGQMPGNPDSDSDATS